MKPGGQGWVGALPVGGGPASMAPSPPVSNSETLPGGWGLGPAEDPLTPRRQDRSTTQHPALRVAPPRTPRLPSPGHPCPAVPGHSGASPGAPGFARTPPQGHHCPHPTLPRPRPGCTGTAGPPTPRSANAHCFAHSHAWAPALPRGGGMLGCSSRRDGPQEDSGTGLCGLRRWRARVPWTRGGWARDAGGLRPGEAGQQGEGSGPPWPAVRAFGWLAGTCLRCGAEWRPPRQDSRSQARPRAP